MSALFHRIWTPMAMGKIQQCNYLVSRNRNCTFTTIKSISIRPNNHNVNVNVQKSDDILKLLCGTSKSSSGVQIVVSKSQSIVPRTSHYKYKCLNLNHNRNNLHGVFERGLGSGFSQIHRQIHTTPRNYGPIPPVLVILFSRIAKVGAILVGRYFRKWWQKLPKEKKLEYFKKAYGKRIFIASILGLLAFGALVYYETHIQITPITERKRFVAFTPEQFCEISNQEFKILLELNKNRIVPTSSNSPLYTRVSNVAHRILDANKDLENLRDKKWTITVVDDPNERNAFVLPCGNIFVYSGILNFCDTDDQLAVILSHEMSHCVLGHGAEQASQAHLLDMLFLLPIAVLWAIFPSDLTASIAHIVVSSISKILFTLPYGRHLENEADYVGLLMAAKACFDIREATILWEKMSILSQVEGEPEIEWLSTHPTHETRIKQLEEMMPFALTIREKSKCSRLNFLDTHKRIEEYRQKLQKALKLKGKITTDELAYALKSPGGP